jgi:hypothetical protein
MHQDREIKLQHFGGGFYMKGYLNESSLNLINLHGYILQYLEAPHEALSHVQTMSTVCLKRVMLLEMCLRILKALCKNLLRVDSC